MLQVYIATPILGPVSLGTLGFLPFPPLARLRGHPCVRAAGLKKMPSSGFRSLIMSMHFCNYVFLYGMADSSDRYDKQSFT